jgi:hypothetical protein
MIATAASRTIETTSIEMRGRRMLLADCASGGGAG